MNLRDIWTEIKWRLFGRRVLEAYIRETFNQARAEAWNDKYAREDEEVDKRWPLDCDTDEHDIEASAQQLAPVKEYVLGFLFDNSASQVVLINKHKGPECVKGRWNGVGGKVEENESADSAMVREWNEETQLPHLVEVHAQQYPLKWIYFCLYSGKGFCLYIYYATQPAMVFYDITGREEEEVEIFHVDELPNTVANVRWLIEMARSMISKQETAERFEVIEFGTNQENV